MAGTNAKLPEKKRADKGIARTKVNQRSAGKPHSVKMLTIGVECCHLEPIAPR
ncbi:MAG TPA: hypothetical protein VFI31_19225 [Pirellulales bacterium]|nr:hypothetical protein [Pirellulales bacterium]